jgi:hypothetical protein
MAGERIRLAKATGAERVDFERRVIYGASAAQMGEALGHQLWLDGKTLETVAFLGNRGLSPNGRRRDGVKVRFTHPGLSSDGFGKTLGRGKNFHVEGDKVLFDIHFVESAFRAGLDGGDSLGDYVLHLADEDPDLFGMSIVFRGKGFWVMADGSEREADPFEPAPEGAAYKYPAVRVEQLDAVDAVDEPAANRDGMFSEYAAFLWATNQDASDAFADIDELLERYGVSQDKAKEFTRRYFTARGVREDEGPMAMDEVVYTGTGGSVASNSLGLSAYATNTFVADPPLQIAAPAPDHSEALAEVQAQMAALQREHALTTLRLKLSQSGLSHDGQNVIWEAVDNGASVDRADSMIESQRRAEAKLREVSVVQGIHPLGHVTGMLSDIDKLTAAFEALVDGRRPAHGLKPLSGIREAYMTFSGDYDMTGMFHPENVSFAAITTATMPHIMANVLNKKVIMTFNSYDRWWERITVLDDAPNMQQLRWHKMGGIGEMPTVAEGASYTETEWAEDYETAEWNKKGHYLGLTIEAIDKDDTRKLQEAPRALAQSAYLTLGKDVSRMFLTNSGNGPVMRDTLNWFHVTHANLGSAAFSLTSVKDTIRNMRKQTEIGTGERLTGGLNKPKYFLVPLELEDAALELLGSPYDPGEGTTTSYRKTNILAGSDSNQGALAAARERVIVMDHWTDANDWVAIADPSLFPAIGLSFRFGREPELFSVADPNSGLMFTNDTMPIKVRWFYSLGAIDHRGVYKHKVT